jgi:hypothetical protein
MKLPDGWSPMTPEEVLQCGDFPTQEAMDRFRGEAAEDPPMKPNDPLSADLTSINSTEEIHHGRV